MKLELSDDGRFLTVADNDGDEHVLDLDDRMVQKSRFLKRFTELGDDIRERAASIALARSHSRLEPVRNVDDAIVHLQRVYDGHNGYLPDHAALCGRTAQRFEGDGFNFVPGHLTDPDTAPVDLMWCGKCKNIAGTDDTAYFAWPRDLTFKSGYHWYNLGPGRDGKIRFHIRHDVFASYDDPHSSGRATYLYARGLSALCRRDIPKGALGIRMEQGPQNEAVYCETCLAAYKQERDDERRRDAGRAERISAPAAETRK